MKFKKKQSSVSLKAPITTEDGKTYPVGTRGYWINKNGQQYFKVQGEDTAISGVSYHSDVDNSGR